MNIALPLSLYCIDAINYTREAYISYVDVYTEKRNGTAYLTFKPKEVFTIDEQNEIINSFLNYLLQYIASKL